MCRNNNMKTKAVKFKSLHPRNNLLPSFGDFSSFQLVWLSATFFPGAEIEKSQKKKIKRNDAPPATIIALIDGIFVEPWRPHPLAPHKRKAHERKLHGNKFFRFVWESLVRS